MKTIITILTFITLSSAAYAIPMMNNVMGQQQPKPIPQATLHPCAKISNACTKAGYYQGGADKGKGIAENCVIPILSGEQVPGVVVPDADVKVCQLAHMPH